MDSPVVDVGLVLPVLVVPMGTVVAQTIGIVRNTVADIIRIVRPSCIDVFLSDIINYSKKEEKYNLPVMVIIFRKKLK